MTEHPVKPTVIFSPALFKGVHLCGLSTTANTDGPAKGLDAVWTLANEATYF